MNASAIMFNIRDTHIDLPRKRFSNQLYIFFLDESPTDTYEHFTVNTRPVHGHGFWIRTRIYP